MNVFGIKNSNKTYELTVEIYHEMTNDGEAPYCSLTSKNKMAHYAICPSCKNPVLICNLYTGEENKIFAKHHPKSISGLADHQRDNYVKCPYSSLNNNSFNSKLLEKDKGKINDIIEEINHHESHIRKCIQRVTSINISVNLFERFLFAFKAEEGYNFRYVHYLNVPYSIMYLSGRQSLLMQHLRNDSSLIDAINESQYFLVSDKNQIIRKNVDHDKSSQIQLYFNKFKNRNKELFVTMNIEEKNNDVSTLIYQEEIHIDLGKYALIREDE